MRRGWVVLAATVLTAAGCTSGSSDTAPPETVPADVTTVTTGPTTSTEAPGNTATSPPGGSSTSSGSGSTAGSTTVAATTTRPIPPETGLLQDIEVTFDPATGNYDIVWFADPEVLEVSILASTDPNITVGNVVFEPPIPAGDGHFVATGLDPTRHYVFALIPDGNNPLAATVGVRVVDVEGTSNFRDIGGYRTYGGSGVKFGFLYRSGAFNALTPAGSTKYTRLRVATVVDLRGEAERAIGGADPLVRGQTGVVLPVYDAESDLVFEALEVIATGDAAAEQALLGDGRAERSRIAGAEYLVTSPEALAAYREMLLLLADPASYPVQIHDTRGIDRTGWATAIVLMLLDVPRETIVDDYLLSNELLDADIDATIASLGDTLSDPALLRPLLQAKTDYLRAGFSAMEEEFGSFEVYLRDGLQIDDATREQIRVNLLYGYVAQL
jgi:protein-tyrosine phosphatase